MGSTVIEYASPGLSGRKPLRWGIASLAFAILALLPFGFACAAALKFDWRAKGGDAWIAFGICWQAGIYPAVAGLLCGLVEVSRREPKQLYTRLGLWMSGSMAIGLAVVLIVVAIARI
jgi:hypothetical protein